MSAHCQFSFCPLPASRDGYCSAHVGDDLCNTCGKPKGAPYRIYDERGKVTSGCVDEFHTGHLVTPSESAWWHSRPEAKRIRRQSAKARR